MVNLHVLCPVFNPDPRKKYHVKLLAFSFVGEGYQADRTISTPGCVCKHRRAVLTRSPSPYYAGNIKLHYGLALFPNVITFPIVYRLHDSGARSSGASSSSTASRVRASQRLLLRLPALGPARLQQRTNRQLHGALQPGRPPERLARPLLTDVSIREREREGG